MPATTKSKAQERFVNLQKRDQAVRRDIETADRIRSEKVARLRELRLAKEAEAAAEGRKKTAEKSQSLAGRKAKNRSSAAAEAAER